MKNIGMQLINDGWLMMIGIIGDYTGMTNFEGEHSRLQWTRTSCSLVDKPFEDIPYFQTHPYCIGSPAGMGNC